MPSFVGPLSIARARMRNGVFRPHLWFFLCLKWRRVTFRQLAPSVPDALRENSPCGGAQASARSSIKAMLPTEVRRSN